MEIVIKIPERLWTKQLTADDYIEIVNAVANGTPLPKGHGKLKSEEDILSVIMFSKLFDNAKVGEVKEALLNIPTIIEADEGEEDKYV